MKMNAFQRLAKSLRINPSEKNKVELIKEIQRKQGNFDCFGSAEDYCDQHNCLFRASCLSERH
ncbi:MAG: SAP domain-containing protein [Syntrophobacteraceae bacterium]